MATTRGSKSRRRSRRAPSAATRRRRIAAHKTGFKHSGMFEAAETAIRKGNEKREREANA